MRIGAASNYSLAGNSTRPNATGSMPPGVTTSTPLAPPAGGGRSLRVVLIALGALGLAAVAVAAIVLTTRHSNSARHAAPAAYRTRLQGTLSPLLSANRRLSSALGAVDPTNSNVGSAKNAATAAQTAVATARGAVGALSVPSAQSALAQQVQQALDNESGYVQAVSATLADPHSSQAGQLQTLATSLQTSLVPLDAVAASAASSVSGTGSLTSWANAAASRARHRAHAQTHSTTTVTATTSAAGSSGATASAASSSDPYANGENCGGGLYAGPNTSCPFAENVYQAYMSAPGDVATVQAYSPVTDQTYSMSCSPAGAGITCSGANDASVSW